MAPLDPFAEAFDSIPLRAAYAAAAEEALGAPTAWERGEEPAPEPHEPGHSLPGHSLIDNAGGRFAIDRASGLITLADEALLESERDTVHAARMRVIEPSGESYELSLRLQITGMIPHVCGHTGFAGPEQIERTPWRDFAVSTARLAGRTGAPSSRARFGTALAEAALSALEVEAALRLDEVPPLAMAHKAWSL